MNNKHKKLTIQELTARINQYRREANKYNISSPYRIDKYCQFRLKGLSEEQTIIKVRSNK